MTRRRRLPWWVWAAVGVATAALVAVPLGGWEGVDAAGAERLEPGEEHVAAQFSTSVQSAAVLPVRPGSTLDPEEGVAYLAVYGRVENMTARTQLAPSDLLVVEGAGPHDLTAADSVTLVADPGGLPELQPGLPADLAFVWEIDEGTVAPGDDLRVIVVDRTASESLIGVGTVWLDPRAGAVVELTAAAP